MFRRNDVRAKQQGFGRQSRLNIFGRQDAGQVDGQEIFRHRRARQEVQAVQVLRHHLRIACHVSLGRIHLGLGSVQVQFGCQTRFVLPPD